MLDTAKFVQYVMRRLGLIQPNKVEVRSDCWQRVDAHASRIPSEKLERSYYGININLVLQIKSSSNFNHYNCKILIKS